MIRPEITSRFGMVLVFGPTARDPTAQSEGLGRSFAHMICFSASKDVIEALEA